MLTPSVSVFYSIAGLIFIEIGTKGQKCASLQPWLVSSHFNLVSKYGCLLLQKPHTVTKTNMCVCVNMIKYL